jgi:hypothetical protein
VPGYINEVDVMKEPSVPLMAQHDTSEAVRRAAVAAFLDYMVEEWGGEEWSCTVLNPAYEDWRNTLARHPWPKLTTRELCMGLRQAGAPNRVIDRRRQGGGRASVYMMVHTVASPPVAQPDAPRTKRRMASAEAQPATSDGQPDLFRMAA